MTKELEMTEILTAFASPLHLPAYPNNTQQVERLVRVVTEVASKRVGYNARHQLILQLLESMKAMPLFNTKKHDAVFLS